MSEMELGVTVCPHCDEQRWAGTGQCMSEQCMPGRADLPLGHLPPPAQCCTNPNEDAR